MDCGRSAQEAAVFMGFEFARDGFRKTRAVRSRVVGKLGTVENAGWLNPPSEDCQAPNCTSGGEERGVVHLGRREERRHWANYFAPRTRVFVRI